MNSRVEAATWLGVRRSKIREDAWPIALRQHVFAVAGTVDLDPWFHKVHACDAETICAPESAKHEDSCDVMPHAMVLLIFFQATSKNRPHTVLTSVLHFANEGPN